MNSALISCLILPLAILVNEISTTNILDGGGSGILTGTIGLYSGNMMPSPGHKQPGPSPLSTTVFITEVSNEYNSALLIDSTVSNSEGFFKMTLPAGKYSLFLRDGDRIICPGWRSSDCHPVTIKAGETTKTKANVDNAAW